ncbi:MAG: hypothetical protein AB8B86_08270 [Pseudomonadales bacterium]
MRALFAAAIVIHLLREYFSNRVHENVIPAVIFAGKMFQAADAVQISNTNHFISLEQAEVVKSAVLGLPE